MSMVVRAGVLFNTYTDGELVGSSERERERVSA